MRTLRKLICSLVGHRWAAKRNERLCLRCGRRQRRARWLAYEPWLDVD